MNLNIELSLCNAMVRDLFCLRFRYFVLTWIRIFTMIETSGNLALAARGNYWFCFKALDDNGTKYQLWLRNRSDLPGINNLDIAPGYRN